MNGGQGENKSELQTLILAKYSLINVVAYEETRVLDFLSKISKKLGYNLYHWSYTTGIRKYEGNNKHSVVEETMEPTMAMMEILKPSKEDAIYVLKDAHGYMNDPTFIRSLKDASAVLRGTRRLVILLSPVMKVPLELEKHMAVVEWGMPSRADLSAVIDSIINEVKGAKQQRKINVKLSRPEREAILNALVGLTTEEAESVCLKSIASKLKFDISLVIKEKEQIIRKSEILEYFPNSDTMDQVGGVDLLKDYIKRRRRAFSEDATTINLDPLKGLLLIGVSGGGKTLVAKVVANCFGVPLLRLDVGKVMAGVVGSSEENMRRVIKTAEAVAPCVLMVDELEKSFSGVKSSNFSDAGTTARVFSSFLTWMQEKKTAVYVVATANDISLLPPEVLRKGRFDEIFFVDLPSKEERDDIFKIHLNKRDIKASKYDTLKLAEMTENFTGAEIEQAIISARYNAFDCNRELSQKDLTTSVGETVPLATTMYEKVEELREWSAGRARPASTHQKNEFEITIKEGANLNPKG